MYIMLYSTVLRDNFQGLIFSRISNQAAKFSAVKMDVQCISPLKKLAILTKLDPSPTIQLFYMQCMYA